MTLSIGEQYRLPFFFEHTPHFAIYHPFITDLPSGDTNATAIKDKSHNDD
jgi:hypothetical protein